jgi:hypothetical protein
VTRTGANSTIKILVMWNFLEAGPQVKIPTRNLTKCIQTYRQRLRQSPGSYTLTVVIEIIEFA